MKHWLENACDFLPPPSSASSPRPTPPPAQDAPPPFLFLEDPLLLAATTTVAGPQLAENTTPGTVLESTAPNGGAPREQGGNDNPGGRAALSFTAEHVRNLADVAGAPSLENGLRRSAAEQLRGVILSPGVAEAVASETKRGGQEVTACTSFFWKAVAGFKLSLDLRNSGTVDVVMLLLLLL